MEKKTLKIYTTSFLLNQWQFDANAFVLSLYSLAEIGL